MDWIIDNLVLIAFLVGLAGALAGLAVLGLSGLRLWRTTKAALGVTQGATAELTAEVERLQAATDALPARQAQVQGEVSDLMGRIAALGVVASAAGRLLGAVRAPGRESLK
ncbi:MAG: hypothetical protein RIB67_10355 [Miltoncostaeaceae bacterium]